MMIVRSEPFATDRRHEPRLRVRVSLGRTKSMLMMMAGATLTGLLGCQTAETSNPGLDAGLDASRDAESDAADVAIAGAADASGDAGTDADRGDDARIEVAIDASPGTDAHVSPLPGVTDPRDVIAAVNARLPDELRIEFLGLPTGYELDTERARRGPRTSALTRVTEINTTGPNEVVRMVDADSVGTIHEGTIIIDSRIRDGTAISVPNVILAHVEITDPEAGNLLVTRDASDGLIVVNSWFHDSDADCFRPNSNETYVGNFVEKLGRGPTSHADAFQTFFSDSATQVENVDVLANIIWMPRGVGISGGGEYQTNRAMLFSNDVVNWVVAYNYLVAGNYVVERESSDDIRYLNNVFCPRSECEAFGVRTGGPWTPENWSGNVYKDGSPAPSD